MGTYVLHEQVFPCKSSEPPTSYAAAMTRWPWRKRETRRSNARWTQDEIDELHRRGLAEHVPLVDGQTPSDRWPELEQFFGAYLHQDYDIDGTVDQCVALAIADRDAAGLAEVEANLRELLAQEWREEQLYAALSDLGCDVAPYADDLTHSEWLEAICDRVARALTGGPRS
jgi:CdiI immunity protein